jgi:hypothetical protein
MYKTAVKNESNLPDLTFKSAAAINPSLQSVKPTAGEGSDVHFFYSAVGKVHFAEITVPYSDSVLLWAKSVELKTSRDVEVPTAVNHPADVWKTFTYPYNKAKPQPRASSTRQTRADSARKQAYKLLNLTAYKDKVEAFGTAFPSGSRRWFPIEPKLKKTHPESDVLDAFSVAYALYLRDLFSFEGAASTPPW